MANDDLAETLGEVKGSWKVFHFYCDDEIVREEYLSLDAPVCVVLQKEGNLWGYEIYSEESGETILAEEVEYFGLDSYRQAYNYLSDFSAEIVTEFGLESVVWKLSCGDPESLDIEG